MLGVCWHAVWQLKAELTKTRGADRYQQGRDGLAAIEQILQARVNNVATRQSCVHCTYFNASEPKAASGAINFCARLISGWG